MFTIPWTFVHVLSARTLLVSFRAARWDSGIKFLTTAPTYTAQSVPTPWLALTAAFASPRQCLCTEIILGCKVPQYDFFAKRVNERTWVTGNINPFLQHCLGAATELWPSHICSLPYNLCYTHECTRFEDEDNFYPYFHSSGIWMKNVYIYSRCYT